MTTFALKIIACATMFIDHLAVAIFGTKLLPLAGGWIVLYDVMRGIGRIAFPLFCFLLVQGAIHTKSKPRYLLRIGIFALISEIPFNVALFGKFTEWKPAQIDWTNLITIGKSSFSGTHQNVDFTLLFGLSAVFLILWAANSKEKKVLRWCLAIAGTAVLALLGYFFHTDYGLGGVVQIVLMGSLALPYERVRALRNRWEVRAFVSAAAIIALCVISRNTFELVALLAVPFIANYSGKRGPKTRLTKWGGYLFYPLHLTLLAVVFVLPKILKLG